VDTLLKYTDLSAKDFDRPEWKKLVSELRKGRGEEENNILFLKWDRFSHPINKFIGIQPYNCRNHRVFRTC